MFQATGHLGDRGARKRPDQQARKREEEPDQRAHDRARRSAPGRPEALGPVDHHQVIDQHGEGRDCREDNHDPPRHPRFAEINLVPMAAISTSGVLGIPGRMLPASPINMTTSARAKPTI